MGEGMKTDLVFSKEIELRCDLANLTLRNRD